MTLPSERQWVTIGLFGLSIGMGLMAMVQPALWEIDTFKTVLQAIVITGLLNMVSAFHFAANKSDETKADNTAKAFDALRAQAEASAATPEPDVILEPGETAQAKEEK